MELWNTMEDFFKNLSQEWFAKMKPLDWLGIILMVVGGAF